MRIISTIIRHIKLVLFCENGKQFEYTFHPGYYGLDYNDRGTSANTRFQQCITPRFVHQNIFRSCSYILCLLLGINTSPKVALSSSFCFACVDPIFAIWSRFEKPNKPLRDCRIWAKNVDSKALHKCCPSFVVDLHFECTQFN